MNNGFELRNTPGKGEGIFATRIFKADEMVMRGEIEKELAENDSHASQVSKDRFIRHAGLISKVNHSCSPNCGIHLNETGAHDFVAMKTIEPNEEIAFDYAMRNYTIDHFAAKCGCGAKKCRGNITGWKDLPANIKKEYEGFVAPYLLEIDAENSSN